MTDLRKAAEMALEALERGTTGLAIRAIPALRQALAQPDKPLRLSPVYEYGHIHDASQPEQVITPISPDQYERFCGTCGACTGKPWVGLTDDEVKDILDCRRGGLVDISKAQQLLKDKNT